MTEPANGAASGVPPASVHPTPDELADLGGGIDALDGIDALAALARTRTHVDGCAVCRQRLDELLAASAAVAAELAALPAPPMPADLVARIEQAIAEERTSGLDTAPTAPATPQPPVVETPVVETPVVETPVLASPRDEAGTVIPLSARPSFLRRHGGVFASGAAAAVILAFVAVLVVGHFRDSGNTRVDGASNGTSGTTGVVTTSGINYTTTNLEQALPLLLTHTVSGEGTSTTGGGAGTPQGAGNTPGTLDSAKTPVAPRATTASGFSRAAPGSLPANLTALQTNALALQQCLNNLEIPASTPPIAVDLGQWNGHAAAIFVLPLAAHPDRVAVLVAGAGCPPGQLLFYQQFPKP